MIVEDHFGGFPEDEAEDSVLSLEYKEWDGVGKEVSSIVDGVMVFQCGSMAGRVYFRRRPRKPFSKTG